MMCRIILLSIFLCVPLSISNFEVKAQASEKRPQIKQFRSSFRYIITDNKIDPPLDKTDVARRFVEVLIDKKSFSEENLTTLFKLVSKRFPKPRMLFVVVYTDLEDVETPEEREMGRSSADDSDAPNMQDSATFTRYNGKMSFNINYADGEFEEIVIK